MSTLHEISGCSDETRQADVVFLHGLGGDARETWQHGADESNSWPHWIGKKFPKVGVWSLDYAASPTKRLRWWRRLLQSFSPESSNIGHAMPLPDRAGEVLDLMEQNGVGDRPLLLICHSLGGLLAKQVLRKSNDASKGDPKRGVFHNTRAVMFLATPHAGTVLAKLADAFRVVFGPTASLEDLKAHDPHLRDLQDWYSENSERITTVTYYESKPYLGVEIVNPTSADPGVGKKPIRLDEDHVSIAKPRDTNARVCKAANILLREHVLVPEPQAVVEWRGASNIKAGDTESKITSDKVKGLEQQITEAEARLFELQTRTEKRPNTSDVELFNKFLKLFAKNDLIEFYRLQDFAAVFQTSKVEVLGRFIDLWDNALYDFVDDKVQEAKKDFYEAAEALGHLIAIYAAPTTNSLSSVKGGLPRELEITRGQEINALVPRFVETHEEFVRMGKQRLYGAAGFKPGKIGTRTPTIRPQGTALNFDKTKPKTEKKIAPSKLPKGAELLIGRDQELKVLDRALKSEDSRIIEFVAWGGVGKSALVVDWMARIARQWNGIDCYFDWSFYSQGTRDQSAVSSDQFIAQALTFFGDPDPKLGSAHDRGNRLAELVAQQPTVLILDGLEPLQYGTVPMKGQLKDPAVLALLKGLAQRPFTGLCVLTTREELTDLGSFHGKTVIHHQLEHLGKLAGAALLHRSGATHRGASSIKADDKALQATSAALYP